MLRCFKDGMLSQMEEETLTSTRGDTWGFEQHRRGGGGAPGALNLSALCWGRGSPYFGGRHSSPLEGSPRGGGSATLTVSLTPAPPPPSSCGPHMGWNCGAFKTFASRTCSALCVLLEFFSFQKKERKERHRQEDGAEEGEAPAKKKKTKSAALLQPQTRARGREMRSGSRADVALRGANEARGARGGRGCPARSGHAGRTWGAGTPGRRGRAGRARARARGGRPWRLSRRDETTLLGLRGGARAGAMPSPGVGGRCPAPCGLRP